MFFIMTPRVEATTFSSANFIIKDSVLSVSGQASSTNFRLKGNVSQNFFGSGTIVKLGITDISFPIITSSGSSPSSPVLVTKIVKTIEQLITPPKVVVEEDVIVEEVDDVKIEEIPPVEDQPSEESNLATPSSEGATSGGTGSGSSGASDGDSSFRLITSEGFNIGTLSISWKAIGIATASTVAAAGSASVASVLWGRNIYQFFRTFRQSVKRLYSFFVKIIKRTGGR